MKNNNFSKKLLSVILVANAAVLPICGMQEMCTLYEWTKGVVDTCIIERVKNNPQVSLLMTGVVIIGAGYLWYQNEQFKTLMGQRKWLQEAIEVANAERVSDLLKNQSLVNLIGKEKFSIKGEPSWTLLHAACVARRDERLSMYIITKSLVDAGLAMETLCRHGTPLMYAAHKGNIGALTALLEKGANVNAKADGGWTALHNAVEGYSCSSIEVQLRSDTSIDSLLQYGAEKDVKAKIEIEDGKLLDLTPAEYAQARAKKYETGKRAFEDVEQIKALKALAEKLSVKK